MSATDVADMPFDWGSTLSRGKGGIAGLLARSHGYSSGNWSTHNFYHADGNGNNHLPGEQRTDDGSQLSV